MRGHRRALLLRQIWNGRAREKSDGPRLIACASRVARPPLTSVLGGRGRGRRQGVRPGGRGRGGSPGRVRVPGRQGWSLEGRRVPDGGRGRGRGPLLADGGGAADGPVDLGLLGGPLHATVLVDEVVDEAARVVVLQQVLTHARLQRANASTESGLRRAN